MNLSGMDEVLCVVRDEKNGHYSSGLYMLWRHNIVVLFVSSSFFHIDVLVTWEDGKGCRVTGFYEDFVANQRLKFSSMVSRTTQTGKTK